MHSEDVPLGVLLHKMLQRPHVKNPNPTPPDPISHPVSHHLPCGTLPFAGASTNLGRLAYFRNMSAVGKLLSVSFHFFAFVYFC